MSNRNAHASLHTPLAAQTAAERQDDIHALVTAYYAYVHRLAFSILDDAQEAEDAAQETFIAAHRALPGYRGQSEVKTWLIAIAVNQCRARLRRRQSRQRLHAALQALHLAGPAPSSPEAAAAQNEADRLLWRAVDALDEKHRLVVLLRYVHELSAAEIAAALDTSEGTVHSRLHYARAKLKTQLDGVHFPTEGSDGKP
ncbi:MAG: RNA polymerase sigma factor [Chloroflexi bacterium]|nr:RNA polymerase sigma factor [Chloroflexota bacterium]